MSSKRTSIQIVEKSQLKDNIPVFNQGDTVLVEIVVREGERERTQPFEGIVIGIKNRGLNSAFTVRKISSGVGVERTFQTHSPLIKSIKIKRKGKVRQSKLYYLRDRSGRSARIKEKVKDYIVEYVRRADPQHPEEADKTIREIDNIFNRWKEMQPLKYGSMSLDQSISSSLMYPSGTEKKIEGDQFETPTSMRNVDKECSAKITETLRGQNEI